MDDDRSLDPDPPDERRAAERARDAALVEAVGAGDPDAFGRLYDVWFDPVHDLALRILRDPELAGEVAQDAFLKAWRNLDGLEQPASFGGWLLRITRNAAYNRSAKERRSRAVDDGELAVIEQVGAGASNAPAGFAVEDRLARAEQPSVAVEDAELVGLVWEAVGALGERDRDVLDLQLRHGMSPAEIADVLGTNRNAANQLVHRIRGRLASAVQARVLWRDGEPACAELGRVLAGAEVHEWGPDAMRIADRHAGGCDRCRERQELRLQPGALFAAVPIVVAPVFLKANAAAALTGAGVPLQGSAFAPGASGGAGAGSGASTAGSGSVAPGGVGGPSGVAVTAPVPAEVVAAATPEVPVPQDGAAAGSSGGAARRVAVLATVAVLAVVALLTLAAVELGDSGKPEELALSGTVPPPATPAPGDTAATAPGTEPPTTSAPTTAVVVSPPVADPRSSTTPPTTRLASPTTAPSGPTSSSTSTVTSTTTTSTTIPPPVVRFDLRPPTVSSTVWQLGPSAPSTTPVLSWAVTGLPAGSTVRVWGWEQGLEDGFTSAQPSGSHQLCPGTPGSVCTITDAGTGPWPYHLEVRAADGSLLTERTAALAYVPPPIP